MKVYGGLVGGVGPPEVIPEQIITVHLGFEAGDVPVTKVLAEFIDFLQLQQVDSQHLIAFTICGEEGQGSSGVSGFQSPHCLDP